MKGLISWKVNASKKSIWILNIIGVYITENHIKRLVYLNFKFCLVNVKSLRIIYCNAIQKMMAGTRGSYKTKVFN
jgi:hypothetical protein